MRMPAGLPTLLSGDFRLPAGSLPAVSSVACLCFAGADLMCVGLPRQPAAWPLSSTHSVRIRWLFQPLVCSFALLVTASEQSGVGTLAFFRPTSCPTEYVRQVLVVEILPKNR